MRDEHVNKKQDTRTPLNFVDWLLCGYAEKLIKNNLKRTFARVFTQVIIVLV